MKRAKALLALLLALLMLSGAAVTASAANKVESDENDTLANADEFSVSQTIEGSLKNADDVDYFKFTTAASGLVTVAFKAPSKANANTYYAVSVQTADGLVLTAMDVKGDQTDVKLTFGSAAGTFYVRVAMANVHTADTYTLSVSLDTKALTESEPNNTALEADTLALSVAGESKRYMGNITKDDVDYYAFTTTKPGYVYFYLYNTGLESANLKVTMIAMHGDGENREKSLGSLTLDTLKTDGSKMVSVGAGTYYLKIEGVEGSTGVYETRVFFAEHTASEREYNNETNAANDLLMGQSLQGATFDREDVDYFRIRDAKGTNMTFQFDATTVKGDGTWNVVIYNATDISVPVFQATASNKKVETFDLPTGVDAVYYVKITAGAGLNDGLYKISLIKAPDTPKPQNFFETIRAAIRNMDWSVWADAFSFLTKVPWMDVLRSLFGSFLPR